MAEPTNNDHDLLIKINSNQENMVAAMNKYMEKQDRINTEHTAAIAALQAKDRGDSEKVRTISTQMQQTLNNSNRITEAFGKLEALDERVEAVENEQRNVRTTAYTWNSINSLIASIAAYLGWR